MLPEAVELTEKTPLASSKRLVIGALAAGIAAGAAFLYVTERPDGNQGSGDSVAAANACAASAERATLAGTAAQGHVAAMLAADEPTPLGSLAFKGPDGAAMTLADFSGKTVLVNLWATWCAPCRAEMPALDRLQASQGGDDFEVVAVNIDTGDARKPRAFLDEIGVASLGFYRDETIGVFNDLKRRGLAFGLPVTLLVGKDSCMVASMNGPAEWDSADAVALIEAVRGAE